MDSIEFLFRDNFFSSPPWRTLFDHAVWPEPCVGQGPFIVVHAPAEHFLRIIKDQSVIGGIVGEIVKLVRIVFQIEK